MWKEIQQASSQVNEYTKQLLAEKTYKDGVNIANTLWHNFIAETQAHSNQAEANKDVGIDAKTGNLAVLGQFEQTHPDYRYNGQPFSKYLIEKYDERAKVILDSTKNPIAQKQLTQNIAHYKAKLLEDLAHKEARFVEDKRLYDLEGLIATAEHNVFHDQSQYSQALHDIEQSIGTLSLTPQHKSAKLLAAKKRLAMSAALGTLENNPNGIVDGQTNFSWTDDLPIEALARVRNKAQKKVDQQSAHQKSYLSHHLPDHLQSLVDTGKGIDGFSEAAERNYTPEQFAEFKAIEQLHLDTHDVLTEIKDVKIQEIGKVIERLLPKSGDENYAKKMQLFDMVSKEVNQKIKLAREDAAAFVEKDHGEELEKVTNLVERLKLRKEIQARRGLEAYQQKYLTKSEVASYSEKFVVDDVNLIRENCDNLLSLGGIGHELVKEILSAKGNAAISLPVQKYMEFKAKGDDNAANVFLKMVPLQKEMFASVSTESKKIYDNLLKENKTLKQWYDAAIDNQPENIGVAEKMVDSVRLLSRYYELTQHKSPGAATELAVASLINEQYLQLDASLFIPKQVAYGEQTIYLDRDRMVNNLKLAKHHLSNFDVPFDELHTFGFSVKDLKEKERQRMRERLADGHFRLMPDDQHFYFEVIDEAGNPHPVMRDSENRLVFDVAQMSEASSVRPGQKPIFNHLMDTIDDIVKKDQVAYGR